MKIFSNWLSFKVIKVDIWIDMAKFYLFIRPDITYSLKKHKLSIGVNAYNILNHKQIANYQINDYYSTEEYYSIVPSQYLVNIQFQFYL